MSNLPFTAKGSNGEITFIGSEVLIRRTGLFGALRQFSGMGKGNKDIPISAISAIRLEPASLLNKAFFQVIHAGDLAFRGGSTNIANDDNSVFFGKGSNADFEQMNWAACGCKLWDFEIGYHSRNRVDPSSAQAYTWRQRPKNVNGRAGQKPRQSRPVSNAPGILPSCPIPTFPSISILSVMSIFVVAARQRI
ncbi:hypothetical protein [Pseudomonas savastanoi]|uniref:hypothetical protein n=2 Tax=Pseudomonas savastanoi TaxID=29438 RepID=UPI0018751647|nr:hypothetical protein [Pseudomonas savastanoi]